MNRRKFLTAAALVPIVPFVGKATASVAGTAYNGEFVAHAETVHRWKPQLEAMNGGFAFYAKSGSYGPAPLG